MSYIEWDDFGVVRIRCMGCNVPIIERTYTEMLDMKNPGKKVNVLALRRLSHHTEVPVGLSDGSTTGLPHCIVCAKKGIDVQKAQELRLEAMQEEMIRAGKVTAVIEQAMISQREIKIVKGV